ncbi:XkdN-like protein [Flavonifractor plautii]|nr:XkdN-like protein [Flavonifractor plautii]
MSKFAKFMKENKVAKENEMHPVTKSLCDENGKPLEWEFRHISSKENETIRESCTIEVPVTGKPNMYRPKMKSSLYIQKMIIASVVMPDLYDAELQDSYGVKTPEDLLFAMVDDPGEYNELAAYVQKFQGFNVSFDEKVDEAKN